MNKFISFKLAVAAAIGLMVGCAQPTLNNQSDAEGTLPNGIVIDQETKLRLLSLDSEYRVLSEQKFAQARSLEDDVSKGPSFVEAAKEILLREFGDEGLKYIILQEVKQSVEIAPPSDSRYLIKIGDDGAYNYYMDGTAWNLRTPWNAYNWAKTEVYRRVKSSGSYSYSWAPSTIKAKIADSATSGSERTGNNTREITADGNSNWGWFPSNPGNGRTWHDAYDGIIFNGQAHLQLVF